MSVGVLSVNNCPGVGLLIFGGVGGVVSTTVIVRVICMAELSDESIKLYVYV